MKAKSAIQLLIKLALTALAFWLTLRNMSFTELKTIFASIQYGYLFLAIVCFIISKFWEAQRLNLFYKDTNLVLSWLANFKLYLLGLFYNLFLPGGIGGDGYKVYWLKKKFPDSSVKKIVTPTLLNRLNGLLMLVCMLCIASLFISIQFPFKRFVPLLAIIGFLIYAFIIKMYFYDYYKNVLTTSIYSLLGHGFQTLCVLCILFSVQLFKDIFDYWFVFMTSNIAMVIPITVGGFGARELVLKEASKYFEMLPNFAVSVGLIFNLIRAFVSFTGIYYMIFEDKIGD